MSKKIKKEEGLTGNIVKHADGSGVYFKFDKPLKRGDWQHSPFTSAEISSHFQGVSTAVVGFAATVDVEYDTKDINSFYKPTVKSLKLF